MFFVRFCWVNAGKVGMPADRLLDYEDSRSVNRLGGSLFGLFCAKQEIGGNDEIFRLSCKSGNKHEISS